MYSFSIREKWKESRHNYFESIGITEKDLHKKRSGTYLEYFYFDNPKGFGKEIIYVPDELSTLRGFYKYNKKSKIYENNTFLQNS